VDTLDVIFWSVRYLVFEEPIRRSSGDSWWSWSDRDERLRACPGVRADRAVDRQLVRQAERDAGKRSDGPTSAEREELIRLRRENHRLRQERDILSKAAAGFARESKANPNGFSGS
jgi:hypothetical protein